MAASRLLLGARAVRPVVSDQGIEGHGVEPGNGVRRRAEKAARPAGSGRRSRGAATRTDLAVPGRSPARDGLGERWVDRTGVGSDRAAAAPTAGRRSRRGGCPRRTRGAPSGCRARRGDGPLVDDDSGGVPGRRGRVATGRPPPVRRASVRPRAERCHPGPAGRSGRRPRRPVTRGRERPGCRGRRRWWRRRPRRRRKCDARLRPRRLETSRSTSGDAPRRLPAPFHPLALLASRASRWGRGPGRRRAGWAGCGRRRRSARSSVSPRCGNEHRRVHRAKWRMSPRSPR